MFHRESSIRTTEYGNIFHWGEQHDKHPDQQFLYHALLFRILGGEVAATEFQEFWCDESCKTLRRKENEHQTENRDVLEADAASFRLLVRSAVQESPWIDDKERWVEMVCMGDEDATLCVLIPLLSNLRSLTPPTNASHLNDVMKRIAIASSLPGVLEQPALGKLLMVRFLADNGNCSGMALEEVAKYAAIPSVKRLIISHARSYSREGDFDGWPADLPLSQASEVIFDEATIIPEDVRRFGQGFVGPCIMGQLWCLHGSHAPEEAREPEWDFYELGSGGTKLSWQAADKRSFTGIERGSRKEVLELRFPEAYSEPGFYEPWATSAEFSDAMNAMLVRYDLWDWRKMARVTILALCESG